MSFQGKVVIVTGASSGIGAAIAIKFAKEGAHVSLIGRNLEKLNNVAKLCERSLIIKADITKDEDAKSLVEDTVQHFGQLDVLVNNAGIVSDVKIEQQHAIKEFDQIMTTNIRAPVLVTHLAIPYLFKTKGNIINISSVAAIRVYSVLGFSYYTSKAALDHFTRCIALELAPKGVRANTVNPGPVNTNIFKKNTNEPTEDNLLDDIKKLTALNRISQPEEVADLVLFLASEKARGITGSSFVADNGLTVSG